MHGDLEPEEHHWPEPSHVNDLWEDMDRLNALYEEMMQVIESSLKIDLWRIESKMANSLNEKIDTANMRIKELEILIEHWKDALKKHSNTK